MVKFVIGATVLVILLVIFLWVMVTRFRVSSVDAQDLEPPETHRRKYVWGDVDNPYAVLHAWKQNDGRWRAYLIFCRRSDAVGYITPDHDPTNPQYVDWWFVGSRDRVAEAVRTVPQNTGAYPPEPLPQQWKPPFSTPLLVTHERERMT